MRLATAAVSAAVLSAAVLAAAAIAALLAACGKEEAPPAEPPATGTAGKGAAATAAAKLPEVPPLTEEKARSILSRELRSLGDNDFARDLLGWLADLGDRSGVNAAQEQLLAVHEGEYEDAAAAAVGLEALLAYGEPGVAAKALDLARKSIEADEIDEYIAYALARVEGPERAEAVDLLAKLAEAGDDWASDPATEALARMRVPAAAEALARIAGNAEVAASRRATAAAGLLALGDPRGKESAERLARESADAPEGSELKAQEVLAGFGVEGCTEAAPYVRTILERLLADGTETDFEVEAACDSIARIHARGGGAEQVPFLKELAKRDDGAYLDYAAWALWCLGDDTHAAAVADDLAGYVLAADATDPGRAVEILDSVARRRAARKDPFRRVVDAAAQVRPSPNAPAGAPERIRWLNAAAAHAFLASR